MLDGRQELKRLAGAGERTGRMYFKVYGAMAHSLHDQLFII